MTHNLCKKHVITPENARLRPGLKAHIRGQAKGLHDTVSRSAPPPPPVSTCAGPRPIPLPVSHLPKRFQWPLLPSPIPSLAPAAAAAAAPALALGARRALARRLEDGALDGSNALLEARRAGPRERGRLDQSLRCKHSVAKAHSVQLWKTAAQKLQASGAPPCLHFWHLPVAGARRARCVVLQTCCSESALNAKAAPIVNTVTSPAPVRLQSAC